MSMAISKEMFVSAIKDIQNSKDFFRGLNNYFSSKDCDGYLYPPTCVDTVITLLHTLFGEMDQDELISYFVWELDFGRAYEDGDVLDDDGNNIRLSNAEDLYDFLISSLEEVPAC